MARSSMHLNCLQGVHAPSYMLMLTESLMASEDPKQGVFSVTLITSEKSVNHADYLDYTKIDPTAAHLRELA
jgi:hypothetical protein